MINNLLAYVKNIIAQFLVSDFIYRLIVKRAIKKEFLLLNYGNLSVINQPVYIKSLIYFNIYEKSEINTIKKYINKNIPVVELGSSIGVTTLLCCSLVNNNCHVVAVEANPKLINNLNNTKFANKYEKLNIFHAAIDYSGHDYIDFAIDPNNLGSKKNDGKCLFDSTLVLSTQLNSLLLKYKIREYQLVADIEGAEIEIFLNEKREIFLGCNLIIIELHDTRYQGIQYNKFQISEIIATKTNMRIAETDGKTWVFIK